MARPISPACPSASRHACAARSRDRAKSQCTARPTSCRRSPKPAAPPGHPGLHHHPSATARWCGCARLCACRQSRAFDLGIRPPACRRSTPRSFWRRPAPTAAERRGGRAPNPTPRSSSSRANSRPLLPQSRWRTRLPMEDVIARVREPPTGPAARRSDTRSPACRRPGAQARLCGRRQSRSLCWLRNPHRAGEHHAAAQDRATRSPAATPGTSARHGEEGREHRRRSCASSAQRPTRSRRSPARSARAAATAGSRKARSCASCCRRSPRAQRDCSRSA